MFEAWTLSTGSGVTVGVVDSGIESTHPDLDGQAVPGWDYVQDDAVAQDPNGHGTHVSGTIAAERDNDFGVAGVAPGAKVKPYRVLGQSGSGSEIDVATAFYEAGRAGLRIVNASLGAIGPSAIEEEAIALNPNTLYVVAAGNGGGDQVGDDNDNAGVATYPCAYALANVLCVGASDPEDRPAEFSNFGSRTVDVFAPGVFVNSTWPGGSFMWEHGTSMASPHVAAVAALLLAEHPGLSVAQLKARILEGADEAAALNGLSVAGGRANAYGALTATVAPDPPVVLDPPDVTPPGDGTATPSSTRRPTATATAATTPPTAARASARRAATAARCPPCAPSRRAPRSAS